MFADLLLGWLLTGCECKEDSSSESILLFDIGIIISKQNLYSMQGQPQNYDQGQPQHYQPVQQGPMINHDNQNHIMGQPNMDPNQQTFPQQVQKIVYQLDQILMAIPGIYVKQKMDWFGKII